MHTADWQPPRLPPAHGQSAFEMLLLVTGSVLFVILAVSVVRTAINTNSNAANNTAGGYQNFIAERSASQLVSDSCVAGWHFSEGSGTTTADASGDGHTATLYNTPTWTTGINGNGLQFDGTTEYLQSPTISVTNTITVSAWVNTTNFNQKAIIIEETPINTWLLYLENNGFFYWYSNGDYGRCSDPSNNEWHHLVATQSGSAITLYLDGVSCNTSTGSNVLLNTGGDMVLGSYVVNPNYNFTGTMDEVSVYNRALNANEVRALYNARSALCA